MNPLLRNEDQREPRRILIADDDLDAAESCARLLEMQGFQCRFASSGEAALRIFAEFSPDAVLLDLGMPGLGGNEVAKEIRASNHKVMLIAISGWVRQSDRDQCYAAGFDHHLSKPADPEYLTRLLGSR